jgi:molybdopterin-guanine dinucleotide biosynthesis adapter protein
VRRRPPIVAVSGASGAGKTRLLARLIPALARRGVSVAVLKHTRHDHPLDRPGKDTEVFRRAGAVAAAIEGPRAMALFGPPTGGLHALARLVPAVDLILAEGFKQEPVPRVEVHRRAVSRAFLCGRDPRVFAIVTDEPPPRPVRVFSDAEIEPLADLVCARVGLAGKPRGRERLRVAPTMSSLRGEESGRTVAPGRRQRMPKTTTKRKSGGTRAKTRSSTSRSSTPRSGTSRSGAGRKGGKATLRTRGREFYSEIGRKGAKSRRASAGSKTSARSSGGGASRKGTGARGGRTSRGSRTKTRTTRR